VKRKKKEKREENRKSAVLRKGELDGRVHRVGKEKSPAYPAIPSEFVNKQAVN
jgi:hypothetical protein